MTINVNYKLEIISLKLLLIQLSLFYVFSFFIIINVELCGDVSVFNMKYCTILQTPRLGSKHLPQTLLKHYLLE